MFHIRAGILVSQRDKLKKKPIVCKFLIDPEQVLGINADMNESI